MTKLLTILLAAALGVQAENSFPFPQAPSAASTPRVGIGVVQRKLTLQNAIEMALKNNLEIEIERANTETAQQQIKAARGAFDPSFRYLPGFESRNTPTSSVLQGAGGKLTENVATQNFYYRQRTPWQGGSLNVDFENGRTSTTNAFASLNPFINSRLVIGYTQPLLRNRLIDRERAEIRIRRKQFAGSEADFEARVIDVISRVEQAYWDLVAARQDVEVQQDAVKLAAEQLNRNQRMVNSGTLAPTEISASQAELERRRDTFLSSVGTLTQVENTLKTLLLPGRDNQMWNDEIVPVDTRLPEQPELPDVNAAVSAALSSRPELKSLAFRREANEVEQKLNSDLTKPQVNLVANYASAGLGGSVRAGDNPFSTSNVLLYDRINALSLQAGLAPINPASFGSLPPTLVGGYGTVLSGLFGGNYQSVQVGVALDLTGRNRTAQANYTEALIAAKRLRHEQERASQLIEADVRNALQSIQTARQRIAAAEAGERAAREKVESETRLFQNGESTNFFVLTRQNEYLDARRRNVVAQLDFNKAVARFEQALGNTLSRHQISLH